MKPVEADKAAGCGLSNCRGHSELSNSFAEAWNKLAEVCMIVSATLDDTRHTAVHALYQVILDLVSLLLLWHSIHAPVLNLAELFSKRL